MFISVLSLRVGVGGGGGESALCHWQDWICVWWMGLSQTVTDLCSIHVDVQHAPHPVTSWEPFCPGDLHIVSSAAAYGRRGHWGVSHGRCTRTVEPPEAEVGHKVEWCAQVSIFLFFFFFFLPWLLSHKEEKVKKMQVGVFVALKTEQPLNTNNSHPKLKIQNPSTQYILLRERKSSFELF